MEISNIIIDLLKKRGIESNEDIEEFLSDKPKKTYDPSLLSDLEEGVDLILSKTAQNKKICVYGDYDADGITSTSLMMSILSHLTDKDNLSFYIPSRFEEGYGLNMEAIKLIKNQGVDFIITVDCGSVSRDEVEYAKSLGMEILVTDHHTITDRHADCLLINPKKPGDAYPFKELSGCGVAFKVASLIQKKANLPKNVLTEVLDLVAIGTIGDIMPLIDENRTIVKFGLKLLNSSPRPGLKKLIEAIGLEPGKITSENVGFAIVPHLNASGRIEDASQCVKLMLAKSVDSSVEDIVQDLVRKNQSRKNIQADIFDKAVHILSEEIGDIPSEDNVPGFILIKIDDAHEGITGIVAGKIKEAYHRPTIIVTGTGAEGKLKGTGRSIPGVDLYELLKSHEELFDKFGGHKGACGFTIDENNYTILKRALLFDMAREVVANPSVFKREMTSDLSIKPNDVTMEFAKQIELLQPFGNANPKPVFRIEDIEITDVKYMGQDRQHARFFAENEAGRISCVLFNEASSLINFDESDRIDIFGKIDISTWQGTERLQLKVDEIIEL